MTYVEYLQKNFQENLHTLKPILESYGYADRIGRDRVFDAVVQATLADAAVVIERENFREMLNEPLTRGETPDKMRE